jgi:predicted TIM-barrel enzyme
MVTRASQASRAVAVPKEGTVPHSMGLRTTGQVMTGAVLSSTKMVALQDDEFPQSSVAVHVLVKLYSGPQVPGSESVTKVMVTNASQASRAVAFPNDGINPHSIGLTTTGQVMMGAVLSSTKIVALQEDEFPQASVAVHVLVILYSGPQVPGSESVTKVMMTSEPQASSAVAFPKVGVAPHSIGLTTTGQVMTGAILS